MAKKIATKTDKSATTAANVLAAQSVAVNALAAEHSQSNAKSLDIDLLKKKKIVKTESDQDQSVVTTDQQVADDVVVEGGDQGGSYLGADMVLAQAGNVVAPTTQVTTTAAATGTGLSTGVIVAGVAGGAAIASGSSSSGVVVPAVTVAASAATVNEGSAVLFTVTGRAGYTYAYTLSGVGVGDLDGGALSGTVTLDASGKAVIEVKLKADAVTEGVETITVNVDGKTASASVVDSSLSPQTYTLSADAPSVVELDGAARVMTFTLKLDKAPTEDIVISYDVDASSTASQGNDYTSSAGEVTFLAGQTSAQVQFTIQPDLRDEANETIVVNFTNKATTNGSKLVNDLKATGTIVDDDHSFVFTSTATSSVAENTTAVVVLDGADVDTNENLLEAELLGPDAALFTFVNDSGIAFKSAPNFESPADVGRNNVYNLSVRVLDNDGNSTTQDLVITVTDVNETPTAVTSASTGTVAENAATSTVVYTATASDVDAGEVFSYSLTGVDAGAFAINAATGAVTLRASANFEAQSSYSFTVVATDKGGLSVSKPVTMNVTNVNEAPVGVADTAVVITGNSVTIPVLANDTDVDANTALSISGTPNASVGSVAVVNNELVYTAPNGFQGVATVNYTLTDGALTSTATATVTVGEPAITAAAPSVNEGQDIVFNIKGVENTEYSVELNFTNLDAYNDIVVKVTTDANGNAQFFIPTALDRTTETAQSVSAKIVGTLAAPVTVTVVDTSDNNVAPVAADTSATIAEGVTATGQLSATDVDAEDAGNHTFTTDSVVPGFVLGADGSWTLDATNAAYNSLAVGQTSVRTVNFTVNDNAVAGNGALTDTGTLTITVTGTNDNPVVTVGNVAPTVNENTTLVTSFATSDVDTGDILSAVTLGGEDAALFQIVAATGNLEFRTAPDFEDPTDANRDGIYNVTLNVSDNNGGFASREVAITVADAPENARVFNLTGGGDTGVAFTGDTGDDTFNALDATNAAGAVISTWTVGDALVGGLGNDVFNVIQTAAIANPLAATVAGVETMNVTTAATATLNTTTFGGLNALNTTSVGDADLTAAATTNVTATVTAQAANGITIDGGNNVTLTAVGSNAGAITVGGVVAPVGTIAVTSTPATGAGGAITVTGAAAAVTVLQNATTQNGGTVTVNNGSIVTVTQNTVATKAGGQVTVNGGANTTEVIVTSTGLGTAAAVDIFDVNKASQTAAGTITEVTLGTYGNATINSSALSTVNISGTGGTLGITHGALTVDNVTALTINANGATKGAGASNAITVNDVGITTINLDSSTAVSTIEGLAAAGAKSVNISGDAALTLTTQTLAATAAIVSTNTAGVTLTAALGNTQSFTGGAGADKIEVAGATSTVAYSMGEGNDTVTITSIAGVGMGVGGSIAGNGGTDTLVMAAADAVAASTTADFNTDVTGFESLRLTGAIGANTVDVDGINDVTTVTLAADAAQGIINNINSGATVNQEAAMNAGNALTVNVDGAALSVTDVLNVGLGLVTTKANTNFGTLAAANVETINIATTNSGAAGANDNTLALTGSTGLTTVTVTGTGDLALTGVATVTSINAATLLGGVTIVSNNVTTPVTFTGGLGDDSYTGTVVADTVNLASGGKDTVVFGANLLANGLDTVNGFTGGTFAVAPLVANEDVLNLNGIAANVTLNDGDIANLTSLIFDATTSNLDLVIADNNVNAYLVTTGTATLPGSIVTVGTGAVGEIVVGDAISAYVLQAAAANSTAFNVYRVFDGDNNVGGIAPTVELLGVVNMLNPFDTLVAGNVI